MGGADLQRHRGAREHDPPVLDAAAHRDHGTEARDIVGYSMLQFVVHVPVVLFLVWILNYTL